MVHLFFLWPVAKNGTLFLIDMHGLEIGRAFHSLPMLGQVKLSIPGVTVQNSVDSQLQAYHLIFAPACGSNQIKCLFTCMRLLEMLLQF